MQSQGEQSFRAIQVDGHRQDIRVNLHEFLKVFCTWQKSAWIWLWVDQICIDQSSNKERNHQVAMMGDIYRRATETYMWLGPDPYDGAAFEAISRVNK